MPKISVVFLAITIMGCTGSLWPPALTLGDGELSDCIGYKLVTDVDGATIETCDTMTYQGSGHISKQGAGLFEGALGAARSAAASLLGIQPKPQVVIVQPAEPEP